MMTWKLPMLVVAAVALAGCTMGDESVTVDTPDELDVQTEEDGETTNTTVDTPDRVTVGPGEEDDEDDTNRTG